ncbi:MAG: 5-formyltetrahydrofolate cyclo-ligase [Actinomycetota bacterium]|nr:5-formyltetrahydrofolate cyclo-ligase [Actinomycetota bacterium]
MFGSSSSDLEPRQQKSQLRSALLAARSVRPAAQVTASAEALARTAAAAGLIRRGTTVAAYVSVDSEPGTGPLLTALVDVGATVLLPVVERDAGRLLRWGRFPDAGDLRPGPLGLLQPAPVAGLDLSAAAVIFVPGLAVDRAGHRLGRGAGYYDRALAGGHVAGTRVGIVYDDEFLTTIPAEPHDQRLHAVLTPERHELLPLTRKDLRPH